METPAHGEAARSRPPFLRSSTSAPIRSEAWSTTPAFTRRQSSNSESNSESSPAESRMFRVSSSSRRSVLTVFEVEAVSSSRSAWSATRRSSPAPDSSSPLSASCGHTARGRRAGTLRFTRRDALVFSTTRGKPQSRRNALRAVQHAGDEVGLNGGGRQTVGLHDLRHSFVAIALAHGVTLPEAAMLARHANPRVTLAVYRPHRWRSRGGRGQAPQRGVRRLTAWAQSRTK